MNTIKTFAAATAAFAAIALPMSAANASEPRSATISYADLDLGSAAGQAIFDRRIANAVEQICGPLQNKPLFDRAVRECRAETMRTAMQSRDLAVANYSAQQLARNNREIRLVAR